LASKQLKSKGKKSTVFLQHTIAASCFSEMAIYVLHVAAVLETDLIAERNALHLVRILAFSSLYSRWACSTLTCMTKIRGKITVQRRWRLNPEYYMEYCAMNGARGDRFRLILTILVRVSRVLFSKYGVCATRYQSNESKMVNCHTDYYILTCVILTYGTYHANKRSRYVSYMTWRHSSVKLVFEMLLHNILTIYLTKFSFLESLDYAILLLHATSDCIDFI
jgi:hypothetical protein